jgi:hypothetical protein
MRKSPSLRANGLTLAVSCLVASTALSLIFSATAAAYATPEPPPIYSSAPGLPDNRVYEQVSPANKNGNEAGAVLHSAKQPVGGARRYALAAVDGSSVLFEGSGPMGETASALNPYFVASKNRGRAGWSTRSATPSQLGPAGSPVGDKLNSVFPSADLSHVMFAAGDTYAPEAHCGGAIYLAGSDPFVPAMWLDRPGIEDPIQTNCAIPSPRPETSGAPAGGTPDFSTVYFAYPGTLLAEDESRAPHTATAVNKGAWAWGFYEDREGSLREAGVLPDGDFDEFGAVPAASGHNGGTGTILGRGGLGGIEQGNQVSSQAAPGAPAGSRAFFVSPDPASCTQNGGENNCAVDPPELYVRENGEKSVLVSRDTLLPGVEGLPAPAPAGVLETDSNITNEGVVGIHDVISYVFATPDGSRAFFQSEDKLTAEAPEGPPGDTSPKVYEFDVATGELTYVPNVVGKIVAIDAEGTSLVFVRPAVGGAPAELELWSAGAEGRAGGTVTPITQLPGEGVTNVRMSSDGSVVVFGSSSSLSGAFNSGGFRQIYRYDASSNSLGCVSCAPHGITPTGPAELSGEDSAWEREEASEPPPVGVRGISADGSRVFFDTPDPLAPQDKNTGATLEEHDNEGSNVAVYVPQGRDVYEWENGVVYLISTGKSALNSYILDSSENGDDVFFATSEGLAPGDTDGAYDVYDARVPQSGDNPPPAAVPCEGSVCQGPPNVPVPLTPPASATFAGLGNPASEPASGPPPNKATKKTVKCKRGYVRSKGKCIKQKSKKKAKSHKGGK